MNPSEFITLYNRLTQRLCGKRGTYPLRHTRNMLEKADEFLKWAAENAIKPKHWLIARHDAIKWNRRIPIRSLALQRGKFRHHYDDWIANKMAAFDQEAGDRKKVQADTSRVTGLTVLGEATKSSLSHDPEACLAASKDLSGGWHPASVWCQGCSLAVDCRLFLGERIAKLRLSAEGGNHARC